MTFAEICSILCREPFNLRFSDIAELTDFQIAEILFKHPADEKRAAAPDEDGVSLDEEELCRRVWAAQGMTPTEADAAWAARVNPVDS